METPATPALFAQMDLTPRSDYRPPDASAAPRIARADRSQASLEPIHLDDLLPLDHPARMVWDATGVLDLSAFYDVIRARGTQAGRPATDPRVLVALWIYAAIEGVASGRELAELCGVHAAFKWLAGGLTINYHTLNDFRCGQALALDGLMSNVLGRLTHAGLVSVERITQDGTKVRACAGNGSFKRKETLEEHLKQATEHVQRLRQAADAEGSDPAVLSNQRKAAQRRGAEERLSRIKQAMAELTEVEKARSAHKDPKTRKKPARASITEPQARKMRLPDNGYRTAHNIQFAQDAISRAIVGVMVSNQGSDANLAGPMRSQVEERTGGKVRQQLIDGGYCDLSEIEKADAAGVTMYVPVPKPRKKDQDRYARRKSDSQAVADWRQRMNTEEAKAIYVTRGAVCETVNADLKTFRGLGRLLVRGLEKVKCVALWSALAYNLMHFGKALVDIGCN